MAELLSSKVVVFEAPPSTRSLPTVPTGLTAFHGIAKSGPIGVSTLVTSFGEYTKYFGSYDANADMTFAVEHFFKNGGRACFCTRTNHYTDITNPNSQTALTSSVDIDDRGGAATPAIVNSSDGPWHLDNGDHIDLDFDGGGTQVASISGTPAGEESGSAETYNFSVGGEALTLKINKGFIQTVVFQTGDFVAPAAGTAEEVAAVINGQIVDGQAVVTMTGTKVSIFSDKLGTGSYVEITGGSANVILGFPTSEIQGTGNVADVRNVTPTELAAIITALPPSGGGTATIVGNKVKLTSGALGALAEIDVLGSTVQRVTIFTVGSYFGSAAGTTPTLRVSGKTPGAYADSLSIVIGNATSGDADEFNMEIKENGVLREVFPNLSMTDTDLNYVEDIVNDLDTGSNFIACLDLDSPASSPDDLPSLGTYVPTGGDDGLTGLVDIDFIGSQAGGTGFYALDNIQDVAIGPLCPNRCTSAVQNAQIDYAETMRSGSMFVILGPPAGNSKTQIVTYVGTTASLEGKSEFGAIYWPRTRVVNPSTVVYGNASTLIVDPVGLIAGMFVRTDNALPGGVYRAPAGIEYGQLLGVTGLETEDVLNEAVRDYVDPHRINPITTFQGAPIFVDGHDTLKGNGNFPTVPERRGVIYIEQTIKRGMEIFRHAWNDVGTRADVYRTIYSFLLLQLRRRAFRTKDPATAFDVDVSDALNPPSEEYAGKLNAKVSLATNKPNKWIILVFSQDVRALEEEIASA